MNTDDLIFITNQDIKNLFSGELVEVMYAEAEQCTRANLLVELGSP